MRHGRRAAVLVAAATRRHLRLLSSRPSRALFGRQLAAGALARLLGLLDAVVLACDTGQSRIAGVPLRALWETWLVGMYCLLDQENALAVLTASYAFHMQKIDERLQLGGEWLPQAAQWLKIGGKTKPAPLNYKELAEKVDALLLARGDQAAAVEGYNRLYTGESTYTAHAGLSSLMRHLVSRKGVWELNLNPTARPAGNASMYIAAKFAGILARRVFDEFGVRAQELAEIDSRIPDAAEAMRIRRQPRKRRRESRKP